MTCPALAPNAWPSACTTRILRMTDNREIPRCRVCPRGRELTATVPGFKPGRLHPDTFPQTDKPEATMEQSAQTPQTPLKTDEPEATMEKTTYTTRELADLLGKPLYDVTNAKYSKAAVPKPGSKIAAVCEAMRERGISWDRIVSTPHAGREKKVAAETVPGNASSTPERVTETSIREATKQGMESPDAVLDSNPEPDAPYAASAAPEPAASESRFVSSGRAISRELSTTELVEDTVNRLTGRGPIPGSIGAAMSLEDILDELRRRLPGAGITITLGGM
jgi:hypothetical protein